jgi:hypothetical protein
MAIGNSPDLEERVVGEVVVPAGGLDKFRLVDFHGVFLIQYRDASGKHFDLILEEDALYRATIEHFKEKGVPLVDWESLPHKTQKFPQVVFPNLGLDSRRDEGS